MKTITPNRWHLICLALLVVIFLIPVVLKMDCTRNPHTPPTIEVDSLTKVVVDTVRHEKPKSVSSIVTGYETVPLGRLVFVDRPGLDLDTSLLSSSIQVPRVTKVYQDSTYKLQISGINPELDFIEVYPRTVYKYINKTVTVNPRPKNWVLYAGAGATLSRDVSPYVQVGLSRRIKHWTISGEVGRSLAGRNDTFFTIDFSRTILSW